MKKSLIGLGLVALGAGIGAVVCVTCREKVKELTDRAVALAEEAMAKAEKVSATVLTQDARSDGFYND